MHAAPAVHALRVALTRQLVEAVAHVGAPVARQHQQDVHVLAAQEQGLVVAMWVVVQLQELHEMETDVEVCRQAGQVRALCVGVHWVCVSRGVHRIAV